MNKHTKKILMGCGIVLLVVLFSLVFIKQIRVNQQGIAEIIKNDYQNLQTSPAGIKKSPDTTAQLERDLGAIKLDSLDSVELDKSLESL